MRKNKIIYKGCENCGNYIYEKGWEDNNEYCLKGIDLNTIPTEKADPNYKCIKWKREID
jgi:hypothetical protein